MLQVEYTGTLEDKNWVIVAFSIGHKMDRLVQFRSIQRYLNMRNIENGSNLDFEMLIWTIKSV